MDEFEFQRVLHLFPVVRTRDYHAESELAKQSTSRSMRQEELKEQKDASSKGATKEISIQGIDPRDAFWEKLKLAAEKKVGAGEAEGFLKAFQRVYKKLVYEELSLAAAKSFINSSKVSGA